MAEYHIMANEPMGDLLESLADEHGVAVADMVRKAIALYKTVKDAEKDGLFPALCDAEGNIKARLTGV